MSPPPPLRLAFDVPSAAADGAPVALLLHGRGSHGRDLLGLRAGLPAGMILVTPEAPHPAAPWGYGPGWAWYRYLGEDRVDPETLETSLAAIDGVLDALDGELPVRPGPITLGGFSQGGSTSLAYALLRPGRVAAAINLSGFLIDGVLERAGPEAAGGLRLFWGHGIHDPAIPHEMARKGRQALVGAGADVTSGDYSMGHQIVADEMDDVREWLESGGAGETG